MKDSDIIEATKPLSDWITGTQVYQKYLMEKDKLNHFPELKEKVNEYRRKNYELQNFVSADALFDKMDAFEAEFASYLENPIINDYLEAELALCRMMQKIYTELTKVLDFDIDVERYMNGGSHEW